MKIIVKTVKISLGGEADESGWLEAEVFDDETFRITFRGAAMRWDTEGRSDCTVEEMPLSIARRLRDFLNYAVPICWLRLPERNKERMQRNGRRNEAIQALPRCHDAICINDCRNHE